MAGGGRGGLLQGLHRWLVPVLDPFAVGRGVVGYAWFLRDMLRYRRLPGAERLRLSEAWPQLHDRVEQSPFAEHYFHQDNWALRRIVERKPAQHVDVGSRVDTASHIAALTPVVFVDLRPLEVELDGFESRRGDILALPFPDRSVPSLSCLHVAEHIGLGRYGDPLDPQGTRKACAELARVLAPGGDLYFSLPVGRPRLRFNAERVHAPSTILQYFDGLELVELSMVESVGKGRDRLVRHVPRARLEAMEYACGLFWFRRPARGPGAPRAPT